MAHEPKLTVYKIILKPITKTKENTFRDLFNSTLYQGKVDDKNTDNIVMADLLQQFFQKVDTDKYIKDEISQKAFTTYQETLGDGKTVTNVELDIPRQIIHGQLYGGPYGRRRQKSNIDDKQKKEEFNKNDIIVDQYYFMLHTPLNSNVGVLMIHSYSDDKIDNAFKAFLQTTLLCYDTTFKAPKIEPFVPDSIKADFRDGAVVNYLTYSSPFVGKVFDEHEELLEDEEFTVLIKVKSKKKHTVGVLEKLRQSIGKKEVLGKPLNDYTKQTIGVKNEGKNLSTIFKVESEIRPVILLKNYKIDVNADNIPNFDQIHKFALGLLQEVKISINPINAVQQH